MFKKWNRILAFLLSIALVTTTFGSDFASAKVYAEENEIVEESDETEEPKEENTIADLPAAEVIPQDELGGENQNGSGNSENNEEGTTPVVTSTEGNGEGTPTPGDPVDTTDEPEYELDENGNPVLDENGNPKLKEKVAEEEIEEEVVETEEEVDGIKIYYVVSNEDAGSVDNDSDVFAEGKEITGSTAEAFDGYEFVNWTDEDGKSVSKKATFIPTASDLGLSEDAEGEEEVKEVTFTANFVEEDQGPTYEMILKESTTVNDVLISFYAAKEVLPDDVYFTVDTVSSDEEAQIADMIEEDLNADTEENIEIKVKKTISFDINFYADSMITDDNPTGKVQPQDGTVRVTFDSISNAAEEVKDADTSLAVYHVEDDMSGVNQEEKLENTTGEKIVIEAEHFSTYTITIYCSEYAIKWGSTFKAVLKDFDKNTEIGTNGKFEPPVDDYDTFIDPKNVAPYMDGYDFERATATNSKTAEKIKHFRLIYGGKHSNDYAQYTTRDNPTKDSHWTSLDSNSTLYFWYKSTSKKLEVTAWVQTGTNQYTNTNQKQNVLYTAANVGNIKGSETITYNNVIYDYSLAQVKEGPQWYNVKEFIVDDAGNAKAKCDEKATAIALNNTNLRFVYVAATKTMNVPLYYINDNNQVTDSGLTQTIEYSSANVSGFNNPQSNITIGGKTYGFVRDEVYVSGYGWYEVESYNLNNGKPSAKLKGYNYSVELANNNLRFVYENDTKKIDVPVVVVNDNDQLVDTTQKQSVEYTKTDVSGFEHPQSIITYNGKTYNYVRTDVYYENAGWYEAGTYYLDNGKPRAKLKINGYYSVEINTGNIRFVYESPVKTLLVQVVDKDGNNIASDIPFEIGPDFNVDQLKHPQNEISKDGFDYVYWKTEVYHENGYYSYWDEAENDDFSKDSKGVYADGVLLKGNNLRFKYSNCGHHLDLGFEDESEFKKYKEDGAEVDVVVNGQSYKMEVGPYDGWDKELKTWEYRLEASKYGRYFKTTDTITFQVKYNNQTYEITTTQGENETASHNCSSNHYPQDVYGFDYKMSFKDKFHAKGNLIYHKNDGSETMEVADLKESDEGVTSFTFSVKNIDKVGFSSGADHEQPGYKFVGWAESADATEATIKPDDTVTVDKNDRKELYAVWAKNNYQVKFDLNGHGKENTKPEDQNVYYGDPVAEPVAPTDDDWDFAGWYKESGCQNKWNFTEDKVTVSPTTLYAKWTRKKTVITYLDGYHTGDAAIYDKLDAEYGLKTPTPKTNPTRPYYNFDYWMDSKGNKVTPANITVTGPATYTAHWSKTIPEGTVKISAITDSKTYDGDALSAGFKVENLPSEFKVIGVTYTANGKTAATQSITNAGSLDYSIASYKIVKGDEDYTAYFNPSVNRDGKLTVDKIVVNVKTGSQTWKFDAQSHRNYDIYINGSETAASLGEGNYASFKPIKGKNETLKFRTDAFAIIPGIEVSNKLDTVVYENADSGNYDVKTDLGKLNITLAEAQFEIKAEDKDFTYNGQLQKYDVVTTVSKPDGYKNFEIEAHVTEDSYVEDFSNATGDVVTVTNKVNTKSIVIYEVGEDGSRKVVTDYFDTSKIKVTDGTLTLSKEAITIKSGNAEREYTGEPLQNTTETKVISGELVNGQQLSQIVTFTDYASVTTVEESGTDGVDNTYTPHETDLAKNYNITYQYGKLKILPRKEALVVTARTVSKKYDGTALSTSDLKNDKGEAYTFDITSGQLIAGDRLVVTTTGSVKDVKDNAANNHEITDVKVMRGTTDVTASYGTITTVKGTLSITARNVTLTSHDWDKQYDGKPLNNATGLAASDISDDPNKGVTIGGDGFITGEGVEDYEFTGSQTIVGKTKGNNVFTYTLKSNTTAGTNGNYVITVVPGTLEVKGRTTPIAVKVQANSDEVLYNGGFHEVTGFEEVVDGIEFAETTKGLKFEVDEVEFYITGLSATSGRQKNVKREGENKQVGTYKVAVTGNLAVTDALGNPVTDQFNVTTADGTLKINPRKLTFTSATGSKQYDGSALTAQWLVQHDSAVSEEVAVTYPAAQGEGFAQGEGVSFKVTGSITYPTEGKNGTVDDTYTYSPTGTTLLDNYDIDKQVGTLTVTDRTDKYVIELEANSNEDLYDGTEKTASGFNTTEFTFDGVTYNVSGIKSELKKTNVNYNATTKTVDSYEVPISGTAIVTAPGGTDVTDQFAVSVKTKGTLLIKQRSINLASVTGSKEYDATVLNSAWLLENNKAYVGDELVDTEIVQTGDGFAPNTNEGFATLTTTGSALMPGDVKENTISYTLNSNTLEGNYKITKLPGTLRIDNRGAKYEVTVTANSTTDMYDGTEKKAEGFKSVTFEGEEYEVKNNTLTFKLNDKVFTITGLTTSDPTATDVVLDGDEETVAAVNNITGQWHVYDGDKEIKDQFDVKTVDGALKITRREVKLTSASGSKEYDGIPLTSKWLVEKHKILQEIIVSGDGFAKREGSTYDVTGSQKLVGGDDHNNTFTYTLNENTKADNYKISTEYGTLTVIGRGNKYQVTVKANSKDNELYDGQEKIVSGFVTGADVEGRVFTQDGDNLKFTENGVEYTISGIRASEKQTKVKRDGKDVSSYTVVADISKAVIRDSDNDVVTDQFEIHKIDGVLTINPRIVTLTSHDWEKEFDGNELNNTTGLKTSSNPNDPNQGVTITGDGFATGEGVTYNFTGKQTLAGESANSFTASYDSNTDPDNYEKKEVAGKLKVKDRTNKYEVTVVANSDLNKKYDGTKQKVEGFEKLTFEVEGHDYTVSGLKATSGEETNASDYDVIISRVNPFVPAKVTDAYGNDVTKQFTVKEQPGKMKINPRAITITSVDGEKEYDGTPLTSEWLVDNKKVAADKVLVIGGEGLVDEQSDVFETLETTGSALYPGDIKENTINYKFKNKTAENNYKVKPMPGTLTVKPRDKAYEVTVIANSDTKKYDGTEQEVSGIKAVKFDGTEYTVGEDGKLTFKLNGQDYTITNVSATGAKATDVVLEGGKETVAAVNNVTGPAVVADAAGKDVTSQFSVTPENGTLTITRRTVTLRAGSAEKPFDAKPLKSATYMIVTGDGIDGFAEPEGKVNEKTGITVKVAGSQTVPNTSDNVITDVIFDGQIAKESNYIVTKEVGKLTVTPLDPENRIKLYVTVKLDEKGTNEVSYMYDGKVQTVTVDPVITHEGITEEIIEDEQQNTNIEEDDYTPVEAEETDFAKSVIDKLLSVGAITAYAADGIERTVNYNGITLTISGIELKGGEGIDVNDYPITIDTSKMVVSISGQPKPVTDQFEIKVIKPESVEEGDNVVGVLHITKRDVVLSSESASQTYNGNALTRPNVTESGSGFVEGEVINVRATGSITNAGSVENTIVYEFNPENEQGLRYLDEETGKDLFENNYDLTLNPGTLTVTNPSSDDDDDDNPGTTTIPDAPVALAPSGAVLGAQRVNGDGPAVLGARRAGTDDETNRMARVFAMVAAAAIAVTMMITGKKKDEEEEG